MSQTLVSCAKCQAPLPVELWNLNELTPCPSCGAPISALVFPALFRNPSGASTGEGILIEGEASCFFHSQKKAAITCDSCGRFLCVLCDLEFHGRHLCPRCLETGTQQGQLAQLETRRILYDDIALALAVYPILFWPITLITAPTALYFAFKYWKTRTSIIPRTQARKLAAILLASLEIAGWIALLVAIIIGRK